MLARFTEPVTSLQIVHYGQEVASGGFNMYDFGDEENMEAS